MSAYLKMGLLLSIAFTSFFQGARATDASLIDLGMTKSQAIVNALDRFRADGYKMDGYRIVVNQTSDIVEVIFVPALTSSDPFTAKPSDLSEVHYYLDASGKKVMRRLFGK